MPSSRPPPLAPLPPDVRERIVVLREEVESWLLEGRARGEDRSLQNTHAALSRFLTRPATGNELVADLDDATAGLNTSLAQLDDGLRLVAAAMYDEALRLLQSTREATVDLIVRFPAWDRPAIESPFLASRGTPALHDAAVVPPPELLETPRAWDAAPKETSTTLPPSSPSPIEDAIVRLGRDALEDIGILGNLRRPYEHEPWADARHFEERLLANLDALWSLDRPEHPDLPRLGVPAAAWRYATEWTLPDWGRAFAMAFSLGCVQSDAALRWVVLGMRRAVPSTLGAFVEGLALASSPSVDDAIADLLADAEEPVLEAGLAILFRRKVFPGGAILPLMLHPSQAVVLGATRCLRHAPRAVALEVLRGACVNATSQIEVAALRELCAHGDEKAPFELREILDDALVGEAEASVGMEALRVLSLRGDPADQDRVLAASSAFPDCIRWLGFHGAPGHVAPLLAHLDELRQSSNGESEEVVSAEEALYRLTGVHADQPVALLEGAIAKRLGASPPRRLRRGLPHNQLLVLDELGASKTRQRDRRELSLELALSWPELPRLDVESWVARQTVDLDSLQAIARRRMTQSSIPPAK